MLLLLPVGRAVCVLCLSTSAMLGILAAERYLYIVLAGICSNFG
jgi:hypothetical protein